MKRDMDLLREILLRVEQCNDPSGIRSEDLGLTERSEGEIYYHVRMLREAGLVSAQDWSSSSGRVWGLINLTPEGHDFLDAIRTNNVWQKLKQNMLKVGGWTAQNLVAAAVDCARMSAEG